MKLDILFERTISDIRLKKIITKGFIDNLDNYTNHFLDYFKVYNNEYADMDDGDIKELPAYKEYLQDELRNKFDDAFEEIFNNIHQGKITLYRDMTVRKDWVEHLAKHPNSRIGKYWSWDEAAADAHWGTFGDKVASIVIEIPEKFIDWEETFQANLQIQEEKEITLFKNTPIKIKAILNKGKPEDISSIENNRYKA